MMRRYESTHFVLANFFVSELRWNWNIMVCLILARDMDQQIASNFGVASI